MKRVIFALITSIALTTASISVPVFALGDVQVSLSCSDGNEMTVAVDLETLRALTDAVAAMSGSGLDCTLTQLPPVLSVFGLTALASSGPQDFAVGGFRYTAPCPIATDGTYTSNVGFSAHVAADGSSPTMAHGSIAETIPDGQCISGHRKTVVTCLVVSSALAVSDAWMDGDVTQTSGFFDGSLTVRFTAEDGTPDKFDETRNASTCPTATIFPAIPVLHGNIVIKDRP
jgi:hypothetical protein